MRIITARTELGWRYDCTGCPTTEPHWVNQPGWIDARTARRVGVEHLIVFHGRKMR